MTQVHDGAREGREPTPGETSREDESPSHGDRAAELLRQIQSGATPDRRVRTDRRATERQRRHLWNLFFVFATMIAILIVLPRYLMVGPGTQVEVPPDELTGTWTTDAPRYQGRFIQIARDQITLGLGPEGRETYPVRSIRVDTADIHRQYLIRYEGAGDLEELLEVFVYDDGLMRLKNPSEVRWSRRPD